MSAPTESRWSLSNTGNRVGLAVLIAWLTWIVFRGVGLTLLVGVAFYVLLTAIVSTRRGS